MSPVAKAVLDETTNALAAAREENANLRRAIDGFLASPRAKSENGRRGEQLRRDLAAAVARKGAPAGTRGTGKSYTAADVNRLCNEVNAKLAKMGKPTADIQPVRSAGGKVDAIATAIKQAHARR
jgi:hypothetical protein